MLRLVVYCVAACLTRPGSWLVRLLAGLMVALGVRSDNRIALLLLGLTHVCRGSGALLGRFVSLARGPARCEHWHSTCAVSFPRLVRFACRAARATVLCRVGYRARLLAVVSGWPRAASGRQAVQVPCHRVTCCATYTYAIFPRQALCASCDMIGHPSRYAHGLDLWA